MKQQHRPLLLKSQSFGIRSFFKRAYRQVLRLGGCPRKIAFGFALGIFVGMTPSMGVQTPIAIMLAAVLNGNRLSAAAGVWISNPVTAPFLYSFTYFVGSKFFTVVGIHPLPDEMTAATLFDMLANAPAIFWILTVGGIVAGIPLAMAAYYFTYSAVLRYRRYLKLKPHSNC